MSRVGDCVSLEKKNDYKIKKNDIALLTILAVAGVLIYFLIKERAKNDLKDKEIKALKDKNKDLLDLLKNNDQIPQEIKEQISRLIDNYNDMDENVSNELIRVLALIEIGQEMKAIRDLVKIIENLLKEKYKEDNRIKGKKFVPLAKLIEYGKEDDLFNEKEYSIACLLKEIINEESHKLNVTETTNMVIMAILGGVELIFRIGKIKKKTPCS